MFDPIKLFPNFIFLPKIVPLVYDDTLSYYEFLCKVLNKLNEAINSLNDIGVDVDALKTAVEELAALINGFDDRIEDLETNMDLVNQAVDNVNTALEGALSDIEDLKASDTSITARLDDIEEQISTDIAAAVAALQSEIGTVSADVNAMQSQVTSNTGRIEALEDATLNAPTEGNENMIIGQFQNLENLDYEIVKVTDNGSDTDNIQVVGGLIRMFPQAAYNEMALVIKNVLPVLVGTFTSSQILSFGLKYKLSSSNGTDYNVNIPFTSLTGSNPYIANSDYTSTRASLRVLQLKVGSDGKSYDLWIYNRYHGDYGILTGANIDILAMAMVFRGFDSSFNTTSIKAYFTTVYGNKAAQVAGLIKKYKPDIVDDAVNSSKTYTDTLVSQSVADVESYQDELNQTDRDNRVMHKTDGFTVSDLRRNDPITIDISDCRFGVDEYAGASSPYSTWWNQLNLWIDIKMVVTGTSMINTPDSLEVAVFNKAAADIDFVIPDWIPLTIHCALPSKAPFAEAYLRSNGSIVFRCWFDDTNYDYTNNPVTIRLAGFVPVALQRSDE